MGATTTRKTTAVTVRNLPIQVHKALKLRAQKNGVSTEAEGLDHGRVDAFCRTGHGAGRVAHTRRRACRVALTKGGLIGPWPDVRQVSNSHVGPVIFRVTDWPYGRPFTRIRKALRFQ